MMVHRFGLLAFSALTVAVLAGCGGPPGDRNAPARITRLGDDLLGTGGEVRVGESVAGDVMLSGGNLAFTGTAGGSLLAAGGNQRIGGTITESVRAAGGNVVLAAKVARNVTAAGGNIVVDSDANITRNASLAAGTVHVRGQVGGALTALGGEVIVDGAIGGDVEVSGGQLRVGPNARISGVLRHRVRAGKVTIDSAARISGGVVALPAAGMGGVARLFNTISLVGFLVAGAAVVALFPRLATAAAASMRERAGAAAAFGVVWLVGIPIVVVAAAVTLVGLPLAMVFTAAYLILLYLGRAAVAVWLGDLVMQRWRSRSAAAPVLSFLIGGVLVILLGLIPMIGSVIGFAIVVVGAGAVLVALWPRREQPQTLS